LAFFPRPPPPLFLAPFFFFFFFFCFLFLAVFAEVLLVLSLHQQLLMGWD
jgi:hypothetical protein